MSQDHDESITKNGERHVTPSHRSRLLTGALLILVVVLAAGNVATYFILSNRLAELERLKRYDGMAAPEETEDRPEFRITNAHEHLYKRDHLGKYLQAARDVGIDRTIFVASSAATLLGKSGELSEMNDWNTREILQAARLFPEEIIPFCTIYEGDPDKLEKLKSYVDAGAKGLKLYTGHGSFHSMGLDHPSMLPIYEYCEEIGLPICWHVRIGYYADEFARVMKQFPDLKVIIPHFGVAFYRPGGQDFRRLEMLLETYPNLYVDTSFGTRSILVHGLEVVSEHREFFRDFIIEHSDRILFGTDLVVTGNREKTEPWVESVLRACRDVLEKDTYYFFMAAKGSEYAYRPANNIYGKLRGLELPEDVLRQVYETNIERVLQSEPALSSSPENE